MVIHSLFLLCLGIVMGNPWVSHKNPYSQPWVWVFMGMGFHGYGFSWVWVFMGMGMGFCGFHGYKNPWNTG